MNDKLRVGIIGCGVISGMHIRALTSLEGVEIAALCDIDRPRAERWALEIGGAMVYTDYRELLARADIDSVHILTPHYLHEEMVLAALAAGKYVLCEKPMATTRAGARAMMAADVHHRLGMIFQNRYNESTVRMKALLDSGEMGAIQTAKAIVTWNRDAAYYASEAWRGTWAMEGGGVLINQSIHTIDQLLYLCGPVVAVKGSVSLDLLEGVIEVEDNAHAVFQFASGANGLLYASNNYGADDPPQITLQCERGVLFLRGACLYRMEGDAYIPIVLPAPVDNGAKAVYGNSHAVQIADYYRCVKSGERYWLDGAEAYPAIWAMLSIYESSRDGNWVQFA